MLNKKVPEQRVPAPSWQSPEITKYHARSTDESDLSQSADH